jgi:hypothetical protein
VSGWLACLIKYSDSNVAEEITLRKPIVEKKENI